MKALLYGIGLQFKFDIRSKGMLITCYIVPLVFFLFMGGIFTSIDPNATKTLISSMTVFTIIMSALFGVPPAVAEIYGTDLKRSIKQTARLYGLALYHNLFRLLYIRLYAVLLYSPFRR